MEQSNPQLRNALPCSFLDVYIHKIINGLNIVLANSVVKRQGENKLRKKLKWAENSLERDMVGLVIPTWDHITTRKSLF